MRGFWHGLRETVGNESEFFNPQRYTLGFLVVLFIVVNLVSGLTPSFQSPDEFNHIKRAYLLSRGHVFQLKTENGCTGGDIDTGLLKYMSTYDPLPFHRDRKLSREETELSRKVNWEGTRSFSGFPNTSLYFPVIYLPQAVGLFIGETLGITVHDSYQVAKVLSLCACLGLVWLTTLIYPMPLMVFALYVIPMSLFQLGAASLDAVSFGLAALIAALFLRGCDAGKSYDSWMYGGLIVSLVVFVTARINFFPLAFLPILLYWQRRDKRFLYISIISVLFILLWVLYAVATVKGMPARPLSTVEIVVFYIKNPIQLLQVLGATFTDTKLLYSYCKMFAGVLGWLDAPINGTSRDIILILLGLGMAFTVSKGPFVSNRYGAVSLLVLTLISTFLMFLILLASWTQHPASVIEGVQGRYFTPVMIFLVYSLFGTRVHPYQKIAGSIILWLLLLVSSVATVHTLLFRYYLS